MFCSQCGTQNHDGDRFCKQCGAALVVGNAPLAPIAGTRPVLSTPQADVVKPSSHSTTRVPQAQAELPEGIKGWCWGGFLLNWIWAIGNKTWWGLLALIPYVNIIVAIWLGLKGRELAWRNGHWQDIAHFNRVQRKWSFWGAVVWGISLLVLVAGLGLYAYQTAHGHNPLSTLLSQKDGQDNYEPEEDPALAQSSAISAPAQAVPIPTPSASAPISGMYTVEAGELQRILAQQPTALDTVGGVLERKRLPNGEAVLLLAGQPLFDANDEEAKWYSLVKKFSLSGGRDAVLVMNAGGMGNSCEALFFFLLIDSTGTKLSKQFGTCSKEGQYYRSDDRITVTLLKMGGQDSYLFENGVLTENGQPVQ